MAPNNQWEAAFHALTTGRLSPLLLSRSAADELRMRLPPDPEEFPDTLYIGLENICCRKHDR